MRSITNVLEPGHPASARYNRLTVNESNIGQPASRAKQDEPMLYCPVCSVRLTERKCKLLCEKCGYYMSCADYY